MCLLVIVGVQLFLVLIFLFSAMFEWQLNVNSKKRQGVLCHFESLQLENPVGREEGWKLWGPPYGQLKGFLQLFISRDGTR